MAVGLPTIGPAVGLATRSAQVADPTSPNFRHYLSPRRVRGPCGGGVGRRLSNRAELGSVQRTHGRHHVSHIASALAVTGPASQFEKALFVNLQYRLRPDGTQFYALDRDPSIALAVPVQAVEGTDSLFPLQPALYGSGPGGSFWGNDFRNAYVPDCQNLDGSGQIVGIAAIGGFSAQDISTYETQSGLSANQTQPVPVQQIVLDNLTQAGPGNDREATMDVEMAIAMAPRLKKVVVYEGSRVLTILNAMATPDPVTGEIAQQLSLLDPASVRYDDLPRLRTGTPSGQAFEQPAEGDRPVLLHLVGRLRRPARRRRP